MTLSQLAVSWCLRHEAVTSVIVGATAAAQLEDNVQASGRDLAPEILDSVDRALSPVIHGSAGARRT